MNEQQFLVEVELPENPDPIFFELIPQQRLQINKMMSEGKIVSYTLSQDRQKLWCIFNATSEADVIVMLSEFPLSNYMKSQIFPLMFHNSVLLSMPAFSKN
jgi:muconolactone delta-isomerase